MGSRRKTGDDLRLPVISRRALLGAGAAVVSGLSWPHSAAGDQHEADRPDLSPRGDADRRLSFAFRRNAYGFYRAAVGAQAGFPETSFHSLAIAIELSLKAYLLHRGISDDWNRSHIGHDLRLALACARRAGLRLVPDGLPDLASSLTPLYEHHAFGRSTTATTVLLPLPQACETVLGLLHGVTVQIAEEIALDEWAPRLRRENTHA